MIKYCPNCTNELSNDTKLASGCKRCNHCGGVYFVIETTSPKNDIELPNRGISISELKDIVMDGTNPILVMGGNGNQSSLLESIHMAQQRLGRNIIVVTPKEDMQFPIDKIEITGHERERGVIVNNPELPKLPFLTENKSPEFLPFLIENRYEGTKFPITRRGRREEKRNRNKKNKKR